MERQGRLGRVKVYADLCDGAVELVVFVGVYSYLLLGRVKLNAEIGDRALQIVDIGAKQPDITGCLNNNDSVKFEVVQPWLSR